MRSSGSKMTKSVSICSEPVTENGPCTKKEEEAAGGVRLDEERCAGAEGGRDAELQAVATELVESVVRLASEAADQRAAAFSSGWGADEDDLNFERLPSILIDTVPSMPPSPTDWPPPPPEATIPEEDESLDQDGTEFQLNGDQHAPNDVQDFASNYIQDLISKAVDIAEEKQKLQDAEAVAQVAAQVVDDVISRASETARERLTEGLVFPEGLPSIQIDTVLSMPPSPTDENEEDRRNASARPIPEITYDQFEDEEPTAKEKTPIGKLIKFSEAPEEVQEFAASYVKDIISKAMTVAEEKLVNAVPFSFEDGDMMKNGPWYIRVRETLMRVLRSACFCTPRRDDS